MPYRFTDHTADAAVEVEAGSLEDLFLLSCHAWRDTALESCDTCSTDSKFISITSPNQEELLIHLLNDLNYMLYSEKWAFNSIGFLELILIEDGIILNAEILGEPFNEENQRIKEEIKAVTYHQIKIEQTSGIYRTKIIFDV